MASYTVVPRTASDLLTSFPLGRAGSGRGRWPILDTPLPILDTPGFPGQRGHHAKGPAPRSTWASVPAPAPSLPPDPGSGPRPWTPHLLSPHRAGRRAVWEAVRRSPSENCGGLPSPARICPWPAAHHRCWARWPRTVQQRRPAGLAQPGLGATLLTQQSPGCRPPPPLHAGHRPAGPAAGPGQREKGHTRQLNPPCTGGPNRGPLTPSRLGLRPPGLGHCVTSRSLCSHSDPGPAPHLPCMLRGCPGR